MKHKIFSSMVFFVFFLIAILFLGYFIIFNDTSPVNALPNENSNLNAIGRKSSSINKYFDDIEKVYGIIRDNFAGEAANEQLFENAIKGMVGSLDPYSEYMNADEYNEFMVSTSGEFGGIGVEIAIEDGIITVISPIEDTPAFRAGILPGDKILEIDGLSTEGLSTMDCAKRARGKPGTPVNLKILHRDADTPVDITLVREIIHLRSIKDVKIINQDNGIGYLRITAFQEDTIGLFDEAIIKLQSQDMQSLIIDLRFNGGGLMEAALKVTNRFIPSGILISLKGKKVNESIKAIKSEARMTNIPLVILVNGGSASASEILAGAVQDYRRATLVGSHTYGKGSVQSVFLINEPDNKTVKGAVKITIARYYTPSGKCLEREKDKKDFGLEPDIVVDMTPKEEAELLKSRLEPQNNSVTEEVSNFVDIQLERAVKYLIEKEAK